MIRFVRSAKVSRGKLPEAIKWAKEVAEYINTKDPVPTIRVYAGLFGDVNTIFWEAEHKDLASVEAALGKLTADPGYWTAVRKSGELIVDGSVRDSVMGSV